MNYRTIVVSIVIILLLPIAVCAEPLVPAQVIEFKGFIEAGLYFSVGPLTEASFNLITTEELLPSGSGVDIGQWTLRVDNPPVEELSYAIQYDYSPIENTNESIEDTIEYVVLERRETEGDRVVKNPADTTDVTITTGLNIDSRIFSVRLTEQGAESALRSAASDEYRAFITVSLISE
mgnify:CR=1 FL=1